MFSFICFCPHIISALERLDEQSLNADQQWVPEKFNNSENASERELSLDEILGHFEEEAPEHVVSEPTVYKPSFLDLSGSLTLGASYNYAHEAPEGNETDYRGISRLRQELDLQLDLNFSKSWDVHVSGRGFYDFAYMINGRNQYTDEVLKTYEKEAEFREAYLRGSLLSDMDVKIGRQIVVWGKSDNIRVVDVLNPLDNREPGLVDIEDLRLPVYMTRMDYYFGKWNLTGIAIHEIRFNKNPEFGSDFFPSNKPPPPEKVPANSLENTEYAMAMNGILTGWDISFYWARFFDDQPHVELVSTGTPPQLELRHGRLTMMGTALNIALGNWLLKSEAAYLYGLEFFALPGKKKSRYDVLIGVEYSGFQDTMISLEFANRHINNFDSRLENEPDDARENEFQTALRYQRDFLHDTCHLTIIALTFDSTGQGGALQRLSIAYDVKDNFSVTGGIVNYLSGDKTEFRNIEDNDRLFLEAKYSF